MQELNLRKDLGASKDSVPNGIVTSFDVIKTVVLDENKAPVDEFLSESEFTIYPGASTEIHLISRIVEAGVVVCEEKFSNIASTFEPSFNQAGQRTVLQGTDYANPLSDGEVTWWHGGASNPFVFSVWDPSITRYTISATGEGCKDYVSDRQSGTFHLNVRHLQSNELIFDAVRNVCPSVSYDYQSNKAGLVSRNPVFDKTGCSIVFKVEKSPYSAEFGFLQIAKSGASGVVSDPQKSESLFTLTSTHKTVDCHQDSKGKYQSLLARSIVSEGTNVDLVYNSTPSVFMAPYFSQSCGNETDTSPLVQSGSYSYSDLHYENYLMMKIGGTGSSVWVPVRKVNWGVDQLDAQCAAPPCGTGLAAPYGNATWYAGGSVNPPKSLDTAWLQNATLPKWNGVLQESFNANLTTTNVTEPHSQVLCGRLAGNQKNYNSHGVISNWTPYTFSRKTLESKYGDYRPGAPSVICPGTPGNASDVVDPIWDRSDWNLYSNSKKGTEGEFRYFWNAGMSLLKKGRDNPGDIGLWFQDPLKGSNNCSFFYNQTSISKNIGWPIYMVSTVLATVAVDRSAWSKDRLSWYTNKCGVGAGGHPIGLGMNFQFTKTDMKEFYQIFGDKSSDYQKELDKEKKCIYKDEESFNSSLLIDGGSAQALWYNSASWAVNVGDVTYEAPFESLERAKIFLSENGYDTKTNVSCQGASADVALYCAEDKGECIPYKTPSGYEFAYIHMAVRLPKSIGSGKRADGDGDFWGSRLWSSKFGQGWLLIHGSLDAITGNHSQIPLCKGRQGDPVTSYGRPAVCFKKSSTFSCKDYYPTLKEKLASVYVFSEKELHVIHQSSSHVPQTTKENFEELYDKWTGFCRSSYSWSSLTSLCASGEDFSRIVRMGKEDPGHIMPLVLKKLANPDAFISHLLYEGITGKRDTGMKSLQEIADGYAREIIEAIYHEDLPFFGDQAEPIATYFET